ncbi:hypothetical protein BGW39_001741 [Mortierella sp. 14UC]|nr:hypothetical protein BGW39_001741 [Mortierella sp. 14UC]
MGAPVSTKGRPVKTGVPTASSTILTVQQAQIQIEDGKKNEKANKDTAIEKTEEIDEHENGDEVKDESTDCEDRGCDDNKTQDKDGGSGKLVAPDEDKDPGNQTAGKDNQDDEKGALAAEKVSGATPLSAALLASSTFLPAGPPTSPPQRPPPTPPSSQLSGFMSQFRAKDTQLLMMKNLVSPRVDLRLRNKAISHHLSPMIDTVEGVLTEWAIGIESGPSIQQRNSDYGSTWLCNGEEKEYSGREAIVHEFKQLVVEDGRTDGDALRLLEEELLMTSREDLVARLQSVSRVKLSSSLLG